MKKGGQVQLLIKRVIDIILSSIGLVLLALPFALIAIVIKLDSRGPVFFRQERVMDKARAQEVREIISKL